MKNQELYAHGDTLAALNGNLPLPDKLRYVHEAIRARHGWIARIAVALYDAASDLLKTYIHSTEGESPLVHYQARLSDSESLKAILEQGRPRVVNDLALFDTQASSHTRRILASGYGASYTLPMYLNGEFFGFIFFDSSEAEVFSDAALADMDVFGHLLSLMVIQELTSLRTLLGALRTTTHITSVRDNETGSHLDRMSRYARLIARALAPAYGFDDEFVEHIFMFSPLHDIGKIGIPDEILLKPGKLDEEEFRIMQGHATIGRSMVDELVRNFGLESFYRVDILRNIAEFHHEAVNGSGYPRGLTRDEIPIESRIVAVADVFDALTSRRPYKDAWSNAEAFSLLEKMAGDKLDHECVQALLHNREQVEQIQRRFAEDSRG